MRSERGMKTTLIITLSLIALLFIAGCTTQCISITPEAKYNGNEHHHPVIIVSGDVFTVYPDAFDKLEVNKTTKVKLEVLPSGTTIITKGDCK